MASDEGAEGAIRRVLVALESANVPYMLTWSREAALQAYGSETLFNVIDLDSGWKIDFIVRKSRPFSLEEFGRRRDAEVLGMTLYIASAEDVILSKLEWAKMAASERQITDAAGIVRTQGADIDVAYVERWVAVMGLQSEWKRCVGRSRPNCYGPSQLM